jgi:hypothetical protein
MFLGECMCLIPVFLGYVYHRIIRRAREMKLRKSGVGLYAPIGTDSPRNSLDTTTVAPVTEERQALIQPALRRSRSEERGRMDPGVEEVGEEMTAATAFLFFAPALCDICGTTLVSEASECKEDLC